MPFYEYKVVPLPEKKPKKRGLKGPALFSHGLQTLMNDQAQDGWEYLRAESLPDEDRKGLLGARETVTRTVLVFRRELYYEDPSETQADTAAPLTLSRAAQDREPLAARAEADANADMDSIYSSVETRTAPDSGAGTWPEPETPDRDAPQQGAVRRPLFGERKDPS